MFVLLGGELSFACKVCCATKFRADNQRYFITIAGMQRVMLKVKNKISNCLHRLAQDKIMLTATAFITIGAMISTPVGIKKSKPINAVRWVSATCADGNYPAHARAPTVLNKNPIDGVNQVISRLRQHPLGLVPRAQDLLPTRLAHTGRCARD